MNEAIATFKQGKHVIIMDDDNHTVLCLPAQFVQASDILFFLKITTGLLYVSCNPLRTSQLNLSNTESQYSLDFKHGITNRASANEKALTIRAIANPEYTSNDFINPGHVLISKASCKGLYEQENHTEAAIELCKLADVYPACLIADVMMPDGSIARPCDVRINNQFSNIPVISIKEIKVLLQIPTVRLPIQLDSTRTMDVELKINKVGADTYFTLIKGNVSGTEDVFLRIHSECMTGDLFRSARCDCGSQLEQSLYLMQSLSEGILIYIKGQEGRGIGIEQKLICYHLQDSEKENTVTANQKLYLPVDDREYPGIIEILKDLKVRSVNLYSKDPKKIKAVGPYLKYATSFHGHITSQNKEYLKVKAEYIHKKNIKIGLVYPMNSYQKYINYLCEQVKKYFIEHDIIVEENSVLGTYELVMGSQALMVQNCNAVLVLGIILRENNHQFETITKGLMKLQIKRNVPIINGLIIGDNGQQINEKIYGEKNQIKEICQATIEMASKKY